MKYAFAFLLSLLFIFSIDSHAEFLSEKTELDVTVQNLQIHNYLKDLEELGYCIIPSVLSTAEAELLYERVWYEFIEKAWPHCRMNDRSNWQSAFPMHNKMGVFAGPAGQIQVMWDLRQDPRIIEVFAAIWNTYDLIVSMDGLSLMCPPEVREGYIEPWPHVDQKILAEENSFADNQDSFVSESSLKTQPFTIQGQFLFEDSFEGDGGFYCIPKSHLRFSEFAPQLEVINELEINPIEKRKTYRKFLDDFFANNVDESGNFYCMQHVSAPKGSVILWDSRTVHWNQHPCKNRAYQDLSKVRMVGYLCYVPKARLSKVGKMLRKETFEKGVSSGHNPCYAQPRCTKNLISPEFEQYLEDSNYILPKVNLTVLGESLLGF